MMGLAGIAGAHRKLVDGSGYPDQLQASDLCLDLRCV
jgi:response regulator RpfG family c-di-GMP phosphodiesterase